MAIGDGLDPLAEGREAYRQRFEFSGERSNLLAVIPGGARAAEYVVIGAHYDHFAPYDPPPPEPTGCQWLDFDDVICNGATDNATGVAIVLAIGRALRSLPAPPARSVVLALWDGQEEGLLGSDHFTENPPVPLEDVVAYLNFDVQGANLAPSLRGVSLAFGAETGGALLESLTDEAIAAVGLDTRRLSVRIDVVHSDYLPFFLLGIPIVSFSDVTNACFHTTEDDVAVVDFGKLARQAEIGFRLTLALAEAEERPQAPGPIVSPNYDDLVVLSDLLTRLLADIDLVFPPYRDELREIEEEARTLVAAGPEAFWEVDAYRLRLRAFALTATGLPCDARLLPEPGGAGSAAAAVALAALAARRSSARRAPREHPRRRH